MQDLASPRTLWETRTSVPDEQFTFCALLFEFLECCGSNGSRCNGMTKVTWLPFWFLLSLSVHGHKRASHPLTKLPLAYKEMVNKTVMMAPGDK